MVRGRAIGEARGRSASLGATAGVELGQPLVGPLQECLVARSSHTGGKFGGRRLIACPVRHELTEPGRARTNRNPAACAAAADVS
jgi:hypothetical protein